jgi:HK97 family phage prohead protease
MDYEKWICGVWKQSRGGQKRFTSIIDNGNLYFKWESKEDEEMKNQGFMERKSYPCELKSVDEEKLLVTAVISTERKDRQQDIMRSAGMRTDSDKIPVLFSHGMGAPGMDPIGKINKLWVDSWKGYPCVCAAVQLFPDDLGRRLYKKMVEGYLNSWSIGYTVQDYDRLSDGGRDCKIWTLYECSAVSVPANADTTTLIESGKFTGFQCKFLSPSATPRTGHFLNLVPYSHNGKTVVWLDDTWVNGILEKTAMETKRYIEHLKGRVQ